ncbi:MAG: Na+/H+ antiporter subunit D [Nocardioidaceae bacterium]|nr:MAG: Na+/H+ antiporter subunit D [Nocardioidaceae bacterium]
MKALVPLPVLLPLLGAGFALVFTKRPKAQRLVSVLILVAVLAISVTLLFAADESGPLVVWIGGWEPPLGISLVADRLAALMLVVSSAVALAVLVYSIGQGMTGDESETPVSIYHPTFLVLVAGVSNAFLAGDLFNLFVSFEMLLFASYVLLTLGGTEGRIRAGTIYVVVNVTSSLLFLTAIAVTYAAVGTVNMAQLSQRLGELPDSVALMLQLLLLTTFCIKAAVFPLSFWLPDSYPTAPAPVTAVFAGLLTKVGVYAILRTQTLLFPTSHLTDLLMWASLLTMVIGILGAIAQSDIKRMLSFTLVSHIGYMVFGIALATKTGISGAVFYVAHHITIQTTLFLVLGLVERRAGSTSLVKLGGVARLSPMLAVIFFIPAMNLAGIPPLSGFLGKIGLLQAGIDVGGPLAWTLVAGGTLVSLLTLYAVAKTWTLAFWRTPAQAHDMAVAIAEEEARDQVIEHRGHVHIGAQRFDASALPDAHESIAAVAIHDPDDLEGADLHELLAQQRLDAHLPRTMLGATIGLVVASVGLTVVASPLFGYTDRAAAELTDPDGYVRTVLAGDHP